MAVPHDSPARRPTGRPLVLALLAPAVLALGPGFAPARSIAFAPCDVPRVDATGGHTDVHEEMDRLVQDVERRLREVDGLLFEAASGNRDAWNSAGPAGLDDLLRASRDRARRSVEDIDRILELAHHPHPPGGT